MEQVGIAELKARLSEYLARVQAGEEIVVADRGRPVARLVPPTTRDRAVEDARLLDLQRRGLITHGPGIPEEYWEIELPGDPTGSVRAALEEERATGR